VTVSLKALSFRAVRPTRSFVLLPLYLMNGLSSLNDTYSEYSPAPADDLIRFWRSEVKGQGHSRPSIEVAKASTSTLVEIHLLVLLYNYVVTVI